MNRWNKRYQYIFDFFLAMLIIMVLCVLGQSVDKETTNNTDSEETAQNIEDTEHEVIETESITELNVDEFTEDEYKAYCKELYYDDVFFGDDDLDGRYVKLHLMLSEKYYFTTDDMYSDTFKSYDEQYHMNRDFYKCCVLRQNTSSYMGQQINMWFSEDFDLNPDDYKTGQKIIIYGKVISWSNNTWDGYNSVTIIPKYIEVK